MAKSKNYLTGETTLYFAVYRYSNNTMDYAKFYKDNWTDDSELRKKISKYGTVISLGADLEEILVHNTETGETWRKYHVTQKTTKWEKCNR